MATHLYIPQEPVTLLRRFLAHSMEISVAGASATCGTIIALIAQNIDELQPGSSLALLPPGIVYGIAAFLTLGGLTALYGLIVREDNIRRELNVEQMGWLLLTAGWTAYILSVALLLTGTLVGVALGAWIAVGAAGRLVALIMLERRTVEAVQENEGDGADHGA